MRCGWLVDISYLGNFLAGESLGPQWREPLVSASFKTPCFLKQICPILGPKRSKRINGGLGPNSPIFEVSSYVVLCFGRRIVRSYLSSHIVKLAKYDPKDTIHLGKQRQKDKSYQLGTPNPGVAGRALWRSSRSV